MGVCCVGSCDLTENIDKNNFQSKMGASWVPVLLFTVIWGIVGGVLPFVLPKGPHKSVIQVVLVLTAVCCWLFWLCCYMSQMNPLIGPILNQRTLFAMKTYWGGWTTEQGSGEED